MIYMLNTANVEKIKNTFGGCLIDGITTNPAILLKEKRDFLEILDDIRQIIGDNTMLHIQVIATEVEEIIKEALFIKKAVGGNIYIKIPASKDGIRAIKMLSGDGMNITATDIFTSQQALMAAANGAKFVVPHINGNDDLSGNDIEAVKNIINELKLYNLNCKVLIDSFKNVRQIHEISKIGIDAITVDLELLDKILESDSANTSVN